MPDVRFVFTKQVELIIPASTEMDAWVEASKINPDLLGEQWTIDIKSGAAPDEIPLDKGPVEIDDWDQFDNF